MLDPKFIVANRDRVAAAARNKREKRAEVERVCELYERRKKLQAGLDELRRRVNETSRRIPGASGAEREVLIEESRRLKERIKAGQADLKELDADLRERLVWIPNIHAEDVPVGPEETANRVVREWGEERRFDFRPREHTEIARRLGLLDFEAPGRIAGSHFLLFRDRGARLERALINFMLDLHTGEHGYVEIAPPVLVNRATMFGTGQLPKLEGDMYRLRDDDLFLIPTAEVPVTNLHAGEILEAEALPARFVAFTPCFRREAGAYGAETRGMVRVHQFDKVELVWYAHPDRSLEALEALVGHAEEVLRRLGLRYRVVLIATEGMSFAGYKQYDLEAWAPGLGRWLEVSSCSVFWDFQARRANIRFRDVDGRVKFVHTLNGSGLALPRTYIALLEQLQRADGSVPVPEVLRPYMGGMEVLK